MKMKTIALSLLAAGALFNSCDKEDLKEDFHAIALVSRTFVTTEATSNSNVTYDSKSELESHNLYEEWEFHLSNYIEDDITDLNIGTFSQDFSRGEIDIVDGEFTGKHILHIGGDSFVFGMSKGGIHYNVTFTLKD